MTQTQIVNTKKKRMQIIKDGVLISNLK